MSVTERDSKRPVAIVGGLRLPFCRIDSAYAEKGPLELMQDCVSEMVRRASLGGERVGEVALGTVFYPPSSWNFARDAMIKSGLDPATPAMFVQRACATSLDAAIVVAQKIASGQMEVAMAGGVESMSGVSLFLPRALSRRIRRTSQAKKLSDRIGAWSGTRLGDLKLGAPGAVEPTTGLSMGQHCERMVKTWHITRREQDELALMSHQNAVKAYERGFYADLVFPYEGVARDNIVRADTSLEKLAKLPPAFDRKEGTLTAGNSSPLTDGAAVVLLASEAWAKARGLEPLAYLTSFEHAAVDIATEGLLMAPAYAAGRLLKRRGKRLEDFTFYEIHEAFAAQVLCTLRAWESEAFCRDKLGLSEPLGSVPRDRLNVAGGSVAVGHPFGATGARLLATGGKLLKEAGQGSCLVSVCTGGGMGTVATLER